MQRDPAERFDALVERSATTDCWLWRGYIRANGYAQFWDGKRPTKAHRWAYMRWRGPIPDGLILDHTCRNRACVNPAHLEAVTQRENLLRSEYTLTAQNAAKRVCGVCGGPYKQEKAGRKCIRCTKKYQARLYRRKRDGLFTQRAS